MPFDASVLALPAALFGIGSGLTVYGVAAQQQRRLTRRRVALFVGDPVAIEAEPEAAVPDPGRWRGISLTPGRRTILGTGLKAVLGISVVGGVLTGSAAAFALAAGAGVALAVLASQQQSHALIESQVAAAVGLLASGLRVGFSLPQAIALVARESPEPTAKEFAQADQEINIGSDLHSALSNLARRTTPDYHLVALMVAVQHEVGGNLVQALEAVNETLRERSELRQQVDALTAQQRLSSIILTVLPVGLFIFMLLTNRAYLDPLLNTLAGRLLLVVAGLMLALGWFVMRAVGRVGEASDGFS